MIKKIAIAVFLVSFAGVFCSENFDISLKLKKGDTFYMTTVSSTTTEMSFMGMDNSQVEVEETVSKFEVVDVNSEFFTIKGSYVYLENPFGKEVEDEMSKMMGEILVTEMKKFEFNFTMNSRGDILSFQSPGLDNILTNAVSQILDEYMKSSEEETEISEEQVQQVKNMLQQLISPMLSDEVLKASYESIFGYIPATPVEIGDSWKDETSLDMGFMVAEVLTDYILADNLNNGYLFHYTSDMNFNMEDFISSMLTSMGMDAEEFSMEVKSEISGGGDLLVDKNSRFFISNRSEFNMKMNMKMSGNIEGESLDFEIPMTLYMKEEVIVTPFLPGKYKE